MIKSRIMGLVGHVALWVRGEVRTEFWCGNLRKKTLVSPKRRWGDYIKIDLQEGGGRVCTGLIWLEIRTDVGLL
jgi:hypothetical protein